MSASDEINRALMGGLPLTQPISVEHLLPSKHQLNPAEWACERLEGYLQEFQDTLDDEHEVGAQLVSFNANSIIHIHSLGYHGPDFITFSGLNQAGERVQLVQHISQINVLFLAAKKLGDTPHRIGFHSDESEGDTTEDAEKE